MRQLIIRNLDGAVVGRITCDDRGKFSIQGETKELEELLKDIVNTTSSKSNAKISELLCRDDGTECLEEIRHKLKGYGFKGIFAHSDKKISSYYRTEFNRIASFYDFLVRLITLPFGGEKRLREKCISLLNLQPADKVLDVCCGTGELTKMISEKIGEMGEVIGIDLSPNMLSIARRKTTEVCFIHASSEDIPYPANYFDKIAISLALHKMPKIVRDNTLREIYRVLKSDGGFLVIDYQGYMTSHELRKEIENNGFQIEQSKLMAMGLIEAILTKKAIISS